MNSQTPFDSFTKIVNFQTQHGNLIGVVDDDIELNWKVSTSVKNLTQLAYRIQSSSYFDFSEILTDSFEVSSSKQFGVVCPAQKLNSRETRFFRVSIKTEFGWTEWSIPAKFEVGLVDQSEMVAEFIGDNSKVGAPNPILRKEFSVDFSATNARLYVTSMGLNEVFINGKRVGDSYLNPGWTSYQDRLLIDAHDVTELLVQGKNVLSAELSDGWWRGRFGFLNQVDHYGSDIGLWCQLEIYDIKGEIHTVKSDSTWKVSTGVTTQSSIYDGCSLDYRLEQQGWRQPNFDDSAWQDASIKDFDRNRLQPRTTEPVLEIARFEMQVEEQTDRKLLRGSQNIAGWVELTVDGKRGQVVTVQHAEILEPGDKLHTKALRSAKATDVYILGKDGVQTLVPRFTFHGFQYADVVTEAKVVSATAIAISSLRRRTGRLSTSDSRLNRLHENVVWSQLDNFVSVPTDCPQRDERLGWTGDAQAFAATSNTLFDTQNFWRSWLIDLELDQFPNGDVGAVVPDLLKLESMVKIAFPDWIFEGRAGWADAAIIVPMALYEYFGDLKVLDKQLNSMRRWVNALDARRDGNKFLPKEFQFGDWCDPDAPGNRPWQSKVSAGFVSNSFFAHSAELLGFAEQLVGDTRNAKTYFETAEVLKKDIWAEFGEEAITNTAGCSIALEFNIVPLAQREFVAARLAEIVRKDKGKITTGFLATPLILHALSKNGYFSEAYLMLMRTEFRSWLYAVDKGATTIWERWDAIRDDGEIHSGDTDTNSGEDDGSMVSFNHYAYGAVVDWMYRNIGGIAPKLSNPGFEKVVVAPIPARGIEFSNCSMETKFGLVKLDWKIDSQGSFVAVLEVPFGASAELHLPISAQSTVVCNGIDFGFEELTHGVFNIVVTEPKIVSYK